MPPEVLKSYLTPVWNREQTLTDICRQKGEGKPERIAEGYEELEVLTAAAEGRAITWTERRLIIRSLKWARAAEKSLRTRLGRPRRLWRP